MEITGWDHQARLDSLTAQVWCLDNDDMAIDVSKHLLESLEDEKITAHERPKSRRERQCSPNSEAVRFFFSRWGVRLVCRALYGG